MRKPNRAKRIVLVLLLISTSLLTGQETGDEGGTDPGEFMRLQNDTDAFVELFRNYMSRDRNITEVVDLFDKVLSRMDNSPSKQFLLAESALLHELLGRLEKAQSLYERAALFFPERILYEKLLRSAEILFETGSFGRASSQSRAILAGSPDEEIRLSAETLLLEIEVREGSGEEAELILRRLFRNIAGNGGEGLSASQLYRMYRAALSLGLAAEAEQVGEVLAGSYPGSPESALISGDTPFSELPGPSDYLLPELLVQGEAETARRSKTADIQTGLFRSRKNAAEMRNRLTEVGFSAEITERRMEGQILFSVLVPDVPLARSQETVLALKEAGFEGFLIFGD